MAINGCGFTRKIQQSKKKKKKKKKKNSRGFLLQRNHDGALFGVVKDKLRVLHVRVLVVAAATGGRALPLVEKERQVPALVKREVARVDQPVGTTDGMSMAATASAHRLPADVERRKIVAKVVKAHPELAILAHQAHRLALGRAQRVPLLRVVGPRPIPLALPPMEKNK